MTLLPLAPRCQRGPCLTVQNVDFLATLLEISRVVLTMTVRNSAGDHGLFPPPLPARAQRPWFGANDQVAVVQDVQLRAPAGLWHRFQSGRGQAGTEGAASTAFPARY